MDYEALYQQRKERVETACANNQPDRVPNCLRIGSYPAAKAGLTNAQQMVDHEATARAHYEFFKSIADDDLLDTGSVPGFTQAAKVLEALDTKTARWPGDPKGLDENNTYQFIEFETLLEDEYDEFFEHPAEFFFTKHLPRTLGIFDELATADYYSLVQSGASGILTSPARIPLYKKLLEACEENQKKNAIYAKYKKMIRDLGYYDTSGGAGGVPFDMLADRLRGTMGMMPDLVLQRDNVKKTLEMFNEMNIQRTVGMCKATNAKYCWFMLHKGFDNFISDEDYGELYWPYLQNIILELIKIGVTPCIYTEGAYTTRLKYLKEVPAGKVVYHFEEVDLAAAKRELGDVAAIMGGFPAYTLTYGTPDQVEDEIKRTLDILAPGGGYLFTTGYSIADCPKENVDRCLEVVHEYGKY